MQRIAADTNSKIAQYLMCLKEFQFKTLVGESPKKILWINMDQVPCYMDMSTGKTSHRKGEKNVEVKSTTGTKLRFTAMPVIMSDGGKGPLYLIFKSKLKTIQNNYNDHLIIRNNTNGWIKEDLLLDWLERVIVNLKVAKNFLLALVIDQCKVHLKETVKKYLDVNNISYFYIPSGCTGMLQPLDVCINKPWKDRLRKYFDDWFKAYGSTDENQTKCGYLKPPSFNDVCKWALNSWNDIDSALIVKSFQYCGNYTIVIFIFL